jgi:hypothetical protein
MFTTLMMHMRIPMKSTWSTLIERTWRFSVWAFHVFHCSVILVIVWQFWCLVYLLISEWQNLACNHSVASTWYPEPSKRFEEEISSLLTPNFVVVEGCPFLFI